MTSNDSILVLGAGELGMAVLRHLARQLSGGGTLPVAPNLNVPVTAGLHVLLRPATIASHDPGKQRDVAELRSLGIGIVAGDIAAASADELCRLFQPFSTVVSCTGFVGGSGTQRKLAHAALAASIRRYVPWQFGVDYDVIGRGSAQDLFDEQLDVRDLLRAQHGTEWLIISTGMFTSFLFEPSFGVVDLPGNHVHALGSLDTAVTVTTANDIGALTAAILLAEPRLRNQVVYTGGDTLTYRRLADLVDSVLHRQVIRQEWSVPYLREELALDPQDALKKYRVVFAEGKGVAWPLATTFNGMHHLPVQSVEDWMRVHLVQHP